MRLLNADGRFAESPRRLARTESTVQSGDVISLARYRALSAEARTGLGVWLAPTDEPAECAAFVPQLQFAAIDFPTFKDGRGYSSATILRSRVGFKGELCAIGDVLVDQLFYLKRVGFTSFALRPDQDPAAAMAALSTFSQSYAGAVDRPLPHFRRHETGSYA